MVLYVRNEIRRPTMAYMVLFEDVRLFSDSTRTFTQAICRPDIIQTNRPADVPRIYAAFTVKVKSWLFCCKTGSVFTILVALTVVTSGQIKHAESNPINFTLIRPLPDSRKGRIPRTFTQD
jgi:hypothetical protein